MRNGLFSLFYVITLLFLLTAQVFAQPYAYVSNSDANTVSVIDTATNNVIATVPVGPDPRGIAITPDATRAYVANRDGTTLSVIDTLTNMVVQTITVGATPFSIAITPDSSTAYVTSLDNGNVVVVDLATTLIDTTVTVGAFPSVIDITPDGTRTYNANFNGSTVNVINTATNMLIGGAIAIGDDPLGVTVSPDGTSVYVANQDSNSISEISTATNMVADTFAGGDSPTRIAITPDGTTAYVTNRDTDMVAEINLATNMIADTIGVGDRPRGIAITPDGTRVYSTNSGDGTGGNTVSVIQIPANMISQTITVGDGPADIRITPYIPATIALTPPTSENPILTNHTVTATFSSAIEGLLVTFDIDSGPNTGLSSTTDGTCSPNPDCTTDASGTVSWTYTSNGMAGTDTIVSSAEATLIGGLVTSNTVTADWFIPTIMLTPVTADNPIFSDHTVTASASSMLGPIAGLLITFEVDSGPNAGLSSTSDGTCFPNADCTTDINGEVMWTYTSNGVTGTDTIVSSADDPVVGGMVVSNTAQKNWFTTTIALTPTSSQNPIFSEHTVSTAFFPVIEGVLTTFVVNSGPNSGLSSASDGTCSPNPDCTTDMNGEVFWTYASNGTAGTDSIVSSADDPLIGGMVVSNTAQKEWIAPNIVLSSIGSVSPILTDHTISAVVSSIFGPVEGVLINFVVESGPNAGLSSETGGMCIPNPDCTTDANGEVSWIYSSELIGTDTIIASSDDPLVGGMATSNEVRVTWILIRNVPTLSEWGLFATAALLGIVGFKVIRRRQKLA